MRIASRVYDYRYLDISVDDTSTLACGQPESVEPQMKLDWLQDLHNASLYLSSEERLFELKSWG